MVLCNVAAVVFGILDEFVDELGLGLIEIIREPRECKTELR